MRDAFLPQAVKQAFGNTLGEAINEIDMLITVADKKKTSAQFQFNSAMKISAVCFVQEK